MFLRKHLRALFVAMFMVALAPIAAYAEGTPLPPVSVTLAPSQGAPPAAVTAPAGPEKQTPPAILKPAAPAQDNGMERVWTVLSIIGVLALIYFMARATQNRDSRYGRPFEHDRPRGRTLNSRERQDLDNEYDLFDDYRSRQQIEPGMEDGLLSRDVQHGQRLEPFNPTPVDPAQAMKPRYARQSSATLVLPFGKDKKTFADVAGQEEAVDRLREICNWLRFPEVYNRHDAKLPRGILVVGPPGTGKTLCAQALAGETHGSMFIIAASAFVEMYVGVGASRVRALFADAKAQRKQTDKPVIIFIDEIDAVGGARSQGSNSNSEREQTLNQLLVELDGFTKNEGIIVIAATNRVDMLDPALRRKGRFDLEIPVDLPDMNGREAILKVHSRGKSIDPAVDFTLLARRTFGMSGADLQAATNEAAIIAARTQSKLENQERERTEPVAESVIGRVLPINIDMFDEAISIVESGEARRERFKAMSREDKKQTAYHELGHAVVIHKTGGDTITKITILPRGRALGYVQTHTEADRWNITDVAMRKRITAAMAGRLAQEIFMQTVDTGAANDFEQANRMARRMVTEFGMSSLGAISIPENGQIGPTLSDKIDQITAEIVAQCAAEARKILEDNRQEIVTLVDLLLEKETIFGSDFVAVFEAEEQKRLNANQSPRD